MNSELRQAVENERGARDEVWAMAVGPNDESEMSASRAVRATAVNRTNAAIDRHEEILTTASRVLSEVRGYGVYETAALAKLRDALHGSER